MAVRDKHRYLLVETSAPTGIETSRSLEYRFYGQIMELVGAINYPRINPRVVRAAGENRLIIRLRHEGLSELITALALMRVFNGKPTAFYTLNASGTISALTKKA